jgi:hypothetical protein
MINTGDPVSKKQKTRRVLSYTCYSINYIDWALGSVFCPGEPFNKKSCRNVWDWKVVYLIVFIPGSTIIRSGFYN